MASDMICLHHGMHHMPWCMYIISLASRGSLAACPPCCTQHLRLVRHFCMAWRLALVARPAVAPDAAVPDPEDPRVQRAAHARQARGAQIVARAQQAVSVDPLALQKCVLLIPGAAEVLGVKRPKRGQAPMEAVVQLAMSPRIRGSGPAVECTRSLQNLAVALVGHTALKRQRHGLEQWLSRQAQNPAVDGNVDDVMRGFTCMWDEASQQAKALRADTFSNAPRHVQVMMTLAALYQVNTTASGCDEHWQWQPWMCPPMWLAETKHQFLLLGLLQVLPYKWSDFASMAELCSGSLITIICMCFDFASSNVTGFGRILGSLEAAPASCASMLLHGERCLVHQLHIVKSSCLSLSKGASMLYSVSRILTSNHSASGLADAIKQQVRSRFAVRHSAPPSNDALLEVFRHTCCLDGDDSEGFGSASSRSGMRSDILRMVEKCHFDRETGQWVYYAPPDGNGRLPQVQLEDAINSVVDPLLRVLVKRRWPKAALSRWTGVLSCMKRMLIGIVMGNVLPRSLSGLSADMNLTEKKVQKLLEELADRIRRGEEVNASDQRATSSARVLKVSAYFQNPSISWQLGVIFIVASLIEQLHWKVIGTPAKGLKKLKLSELVDPVSSEIAAVGQKMFHLLSLWTLERGDWALLSWLGARVAPVKKVMVFARSTLVALAAAYFVRTEMRFSTWPYRLQHLLSPNLSVAQKGITIQAFLQADGCCIGPFGRRYRLEFQGIHNNPCPTCVY